MSIKEKSLLKKHILKELEHLVRYDDSQFVARSKAVSKLPALSFAKLNHSRRAACKVVNLTSTGFVIDITAFDRPVALSAGGPQ